MPRLTRKTKGGQAPPSRSKTSRPKPADPAAEIQAIKAQVSIEKGAEYYGARIDARGAFSCLLPQNHTHGDQHPSARVHDGRVFCYSQGCFGEHGADIFELVGIMENLPKFADQKKFLIDTFGLSGTQSGRRKIEAIYDYLSAAGVLLFQTIRYQPKDFRQRRPDGAGGWIWNLKGVLLVLYRLIEVLAASIVIVLEGEKDVERMYRLGLPPGYAATTSPMGAGKWRAEYSETLRGKKLIIISDVDDPGQKHGQQVAKASTGVASEVLWVDLPKGKDFSDWALQTDATAADVETLLATAHPVEAADPPPIEPDGIFMGDDGEGAGGNGKQRDSRADKLVALERDAGTRFFCDEVGESYAKPRDEPWAMKVKSSDYRRRLIQLSYAATGHAPSTQVLTDALGIFDAQAFLSPPEKVYQRFAAKEGKYAIDLANGAFVLTTADGWGIVKETSFNFIRTIGMEPLPTPIPTTRTLDVVWAPFSNTASEDDAVLGVGAIIGNMCLGGTMAGEFYSGEQGSGKSLTTRFRKALVDPNILSGSAIPDAESDLMLVAANNPVVSWDNESAISPQQSDWICRLTSGGGFGQRTLFTNGEMTIFQFKRPVIINSIVGVISRPDLADRFIPIKLKAFGPGERRGERELQAAFAAAHPEILGALCNCISAALKNSPTLEFKTDERLFDFLKWIAAAEPALDWPPGRFMEAFKRSRAAQDDAILETSPIVDPLYELLASRGGELAETAGQLLPLLESKASERIIKSRAWPSTPRGLRAALERLAPNLRRIGVMVTFSDRTHVGRLICISGSNTSSSEEGR